VFLIVGLIAGALGMAGVAAVATQISWILFLIGVVLILIHLIKCRVPPITYGSNVSQLKEQLYAY
jgi:uncharacterized membrane protein YtjA (UPF0391 family)